jgi:CBS domain-containing protein
MNDDDKAQQNQRNASEATRGLSEAARRGTEASQQAIRQVSEGAVGQANQVVRQLAEAAEAYRAIAGRFAEEVRALTGAPMTAAGGMQELSQTLTEWMADAVRANMRFSQEALQVRSLPEIAQLQARYVEMCLAGLRERSARMLKAAGGVAERMRDPLAHEDEVDDAPLTVGEVMTREVRVASPDDTVQEAAQVMAQADAGVLPVGENDRIVGMLTDRDIAVRVVGAAKDPTRTKVREAMTPGVEYCLEDEELGSVAEKMAEQRLRRLPVLNREKRLVGIVSLGDMATGQPDPGIAGRALGGIAQEGGPHRQRLVRPQPKAAASRQQSQRRRER